MPELPEVETVVRDLRPWLVGRRFTSVWSGCLALRKPWKAAWKKRLVGRRIAALRRRGKWIVMELDDGGRLVVHLGMTGQLTVASTKEPKKAHTHLLFDLDEAGRQMRFRDVRRFGSATLFSSDEEVEASFAAAGLGPEPFGLDPAYWRQRMASTSRCVKAVLLDQSVVAGVGNIYADEALFEARLHPSRIASELGDETADRLRQAVASVLNRAIERRGSTIRDYIGGSGLKGAFQKEFRVYGCAGRPCFRCTALIERIRLAGRSTHFCPKCQKIASFSRDPKGSAIRAPLRVAAKRITSEIEIQLMSYRAFKRLLGETSLERKCRFLFGAFILLLITSSFWLYARQTEGLAYDQLTTTCRLLVKHKVERQLASVCYAPESTRASTAEESKAAQQGLDEFLRAWPAPGSLGEYSWIITRATRPEQMPSDNYTVQRLKEFVDDPNKLEDNDQLLSGSPHIYYAAVRASESCLKCHREIQHRANPDLPEMQAKDLIALIKIEVPSEAIQAIEAGVHVNRAVLISTALITAILIMAGSYLIVRYVIVKPVKHLKEVSDAISAGELNVRSEIQTGDEFEDLSHAFNRMLRNLVNMQDRLRKVNGDLDRKVDELAQANLALYESNRLKSDFLATMSHELRTPLNSILGFSEVLQSAVGLNEKQTRWVGNIRSSGEQLLALINDILDLAKIEAGKMQVRVSQFSIYDICEGLLTMFRPMAEKKNIELRGLFAPDIPLLRQDVVKLQQILSNLLSNAVKFTPEGGRVLLKVDADKTHCTLTVTDTGVGIAAEEQELVFEKFRQAGSALTREHAGTGLGLSIVRELSKLLGGEVTLQSDLGRGSTFTVRLPLHLSEEPGLEFDLAHEGIDLSKAQRVDARLYAGAGAGQETRIDAAALPK